MSEPAETGDLVGFAHDLLIAQLDYQLTDSMNRLSLALPAYQAGALAPDLARAFVERHVRFLLLVHADTPARRAAVAAFDVWKAELFEAADFAVRS